MNCQDPHYQAFGELMQAIDFDTLNGNAQRLAYTRVTTYAKLTARMPGELTINELVSCLEAANTEYNALAKSAQEHLTHNGITKK